jgi:hypothetical protein
MIAKKIGLKTVVFDPTSLDVTGRTLKLFDGTLWRRGSLPHVIYDRCFLTGSNYKRKYAAFIKRLKRNSSTSFLGYGLRDKWSVYQQILANELLAKYLPYTMPYTSFEQLRDLLFDKHSLILKPTSSCQGRGVLLLRKHSNQVAICGRTTGNEALEQLLPLDDMSRWLSSFVGGRKYIVQQALNLNTHDNRPFDLRILMQKDGRGNWYKTGQAVRIGSRNGVTSNLHGGGEACEWSEFCDRELRSFDLQTLNTTIDEVTGALPSYVEKKHGILCELGIDLGVDVHQKQLWLLEVNSRPGRTIFKRIGDLKTFKRAYILPVLYAKSLADKLQYRLTESPVYQNHF